MKSLELLQQEAVCGAGDPMSLGSNATVAYQNPSSQSANGAQPSRTLEQDQATCVGRIESGASTGGVLGGVVGAVTGFVIGGPVGAAVGIGVMGIGVTGGGAWGAANTPACNPGDGYTGPVPAQGGYIDRP